MEDTLEDRNKFIPLVDGPVRTIMKRENKVRVFLNDLKRTKAISEEKYKNLAIPTGSRPGILYGLPKAYKTNIPLRSIPSAIGTHSYNLAGKFLVPLLRPLSIGSYLISDPFSFIQELSSLNYNSSNLLMTGFDITSLFTDIPIDETINIILNEPFSPDQLFHGFSR